MITEFKKVIKLDKHLLKPLILLSAEASPIQAAHLLKLLKISPLDLLEQISISCSVTQDSSYIHHWPAHQGKKIKLSS